MAKYIKKIGRMAYKASGYKNPFKKESYQLQEL